MKLLCRIWLVTIVLILGCGPQVDRSELGTLVSQPPKFDPYDEKYPLPQLEQAPSDADSAEGR